MSSFLDRSPKTDHAPPKWIQYLFFSILPTIFLMRRPRRYRHLQQFSLRSFSIASVRTRRSGSCPNRSTKQHNLSSNHTQQEAVLDPQEAQAHPLNTVKAPQNLARSESITSDLLDDSPRVAEDRTYCMEAIATIADSYRKKDFVRAVSWTLYS